MAKRASLSRVKRLAIFEAHGGICHLCERKIQAGEAWEVSHDRPLELLGADDDENRKPAHKSCHAVQTREHDIPRIAKAKRQKMAALGIRKPSTFPGGRNSRFKRTMSGKVVDRQTGMEVGR
ncbi:MAG: hypothetical protein Unbinned3696contig1008_9 [Prokaryotic dsDNA virus sp.]|nr:MAG: hypothetical protein Unbinned3696contig1008_9 [Prokaryotic dsDNA virus sp.]|tara:strand:+ start:18448 stop:18813 length:366 start_codon:yes stop_codon:yes gene_type:complete